MKKRLFLARSTHEGQGFADLFRTLKSYGIIVNSGLAKVVEGEVGNLDKGKT